MRLPCIHRLHQEQDKHDDIGYAFNDDIAKPEQIVLHTNFFNGCGVFLAELASPVFCSSPPLSFLFSFFVSPFFLAHLLALNLFLAVQTVNTSRT